MLKHFFYVIICLLVSCQTAIKRQIKPKDLILNAKQSTDVASPQIILSAKQVEEDLNNLSYALSHACSVS